MMISMINNSKLRYVRSEVLTALTVNNTVFWGVPWCGVFGIY